MELLAELSWFDLVVIVLLAAGVFVGFTQGLIRYVLNAVAVIVAFVLASQLKDPMVELLGFWDAFTPAGRELLLFWSSSSASRSEGCSRSAPSTIGRACRSSASSTRSAGRSSASSSWRPGDLPSSSSCSTASSFGGQRHGGWVASLYDALNSSLIVDFLRDGAHSDRRFPGPTVRARGLARLLFP